MKKILFTLSVIFLVSAGCNSRPAAQQNQSALPQTQKQQAGANQDAAWKTYSNVKYNFELSYPGNWVLTENGNYITIKPLANSESNFSIATVNVGRDTVFGLGAKVQIKDTIIADKKAKIYDCRQESTGCPANIPASVAIKLTDLPTGWSQGNEIDYEVYDYEHVNVTDFERILNSLKFVEQPITGDKPVITNTSGKAIIGKSKPNYVLWAYPATTVACITRNEMAVYGAGKADANGNFLITIPVVVKKGRIDIVVAAFPENSSYIESGADACFPKSNLSDMTTFNYD